MPLDIQGRLVKGIKVPVLPGPLFPSRLVDVPLFFKGWLSCVECGSIAHLDTGFTIDKGVINGVPYRVHNIASAIFAGEHNPYCTSTEPLYDQTGEPSAREKIAAGWTE